MRRKSIIVLAVLLLTPMLINATESDKTKETIEALSNDVTGTWSAINSGLTNKQVITLAIDPTNTSTLYAGTEGGVFKSTDWGGSWSAINSGLTNTHVWALAIDPTNTSTLYAGTEGGAFKSIDGGGSWSAINSGLTNTHVWALAIDPSNTNTLYAGTESGMFKSTDGGGHWSYCSLPYEVNALAIDPSNPSIVYAVTQSDGIFKSTNGGKSWVAVITGLTCTLGYALAIDPSNPSTIYAGADCAVWKSTDAGGHWFAILITSYGLALAIDPTNPSIIYAGTWGYGIFKSTDGGASWSANNSGLTNILVTALAIDPTNTSIMYAGTWGGVFKFFPTGGLLSLNVSKSGTGDGKVTSNPSGIDCGSTCSGSYDQETSVTLTATPSSGSVFAGWSGACSGTGDCLVTMDSSNKSVTATFNLQGQLGVNISIAPGSLNFGAVNVGQSSKQTITITNQANSTATLTGSVGILSAPFSVVSGGGPFNLAAGQSVAVTVQFSPTTAGAASAALSITHNATNQPNPANVSLSGTGVGTNVSGISVTPTAENYGNVKVNKSKTVSFKVTNTGKGDLFILYSQIKGPDGSMFTITSGRGSKHLDPGNSLTIKVVFKPTSTGSKSSSLEITSNNPVTPTLDIPLSGTGQ
jgi:hypothetical protein